jgi:hypothetical protein
MNGFPVRDIKRGGITKKDISYTSLFSELPKTLA